MKRVAEVISNRKRKLPMQLTESEGKEVLDIVSRICSWRQFNITEREEAIAEIVATIVARLWKHTGLRKPLANYVRYTATRELRRLIKKTRRESKQLCLSDSLEHYVATDRDSTEFNVDLESFEQLEISMSALPAEERVALARFISARKSRLTRREYYMKDRAIKKLRAEWKRGLEA